MLTILTVLNRNFLTGVFYNYTEERQVAILYLSGKKKLVNHRSSTEYSNLEAIRAECARIATEKGDKYSLITYHTPLEDELIKEKLGSWYEDVIKEIGKVQND
jgi:hypothetical protein